MQQSVPAVYEKGVLRLLTPLPLCEGQRVQIVIEPLNGSAPVDASRREAEAHRSMESDGMIERLPPPPEPLPADWKPLVLEGEPLSETVLRMRREA